MVRKKWKPIKNQRTVGFPSELTKKRLFQWVTPKYGYEKIRKIKTSHKPKNLVSTIRTPIEKLTTNCCTSEESAAVILTQTGYIFSPTCPKSECRSVCPPGSIQACQATQAPARASRGKTGNRSTPSTSGQVTCGLRMVKRGTFILIPFRICESDSAFRIGLKIVKKFLSNNKQRHFVCRFKSISESLRSFRSGPWQNCICFELLREKFEPIDQELKYYHAKSCYQALIYVILNPRSGECPTKTTPPICFSTEWKELERVLSSTEQEQENVEYIKVWKF